MMRCHFSRRAIASWKRVEFSALEFQIPESISGDIVELGVYKVNSAKVLHEIIGPERTLYLFDTFAGFDKRDVTGIDGRANRSAFQDTSLEAVRNFVRYNRRRVYLGIFSRER
jgi:hypothetical protein